VAVVSFTSSNLVEAMNKWIPEERRRLSVLDLLHSPWSKRMDLRFRRLQGAQKYHDSGATLTKYSSKLSGKFVTYADDLVRGVTKPS